jgi:acyl carrier protein
MAAGNVKESVKKVFMKVFSVDEKDFGFEKGHEDFDSWDSLSHMSLVSAIEEEFNISLDVDEISDMDSIGKIVETVDRHVRK